MITFIRPAHDGFVLRILTDRDDRMGVNIKTQKNFQKALNDITRKTET